MCEKLSRVWMRSTLDVIPQQRLEVWSIQCASRTHGRSSDADCWSATQSSLSAYHARPYSTSGSSTSTSLPTLQANSHAHGDNWTRKNETSEFGCALLYLLSLSSDCSGRLEHALCLCGSSILQAVGSPLNINHPSPRSSRVSWAPTGEAYPHSISILLRRTPARYLVRTDR